MRGAWKCGLGMCLVAGLVISFVLLTEEHQGSVEVSS